MVRVMVRVRVRVAVTVGNTSRLELWRYTPVETKPTSSKPPATVKVFQPVSPMRVRFRLAAHRVMK